MDRYFTIQPTQGLGNRWRSLISSIIVAEYLNLPVYVHWCESVGFDDTPIDELIDTQYLRDNILTTLEFINYETFSKMKKDAFILSDHFDKVSVDKNDITMFKCKNVNSRYNYIAQLLNTKSISKICTNINMNLVYAFGEECLLEYIPDFWKRYVDISKLFILPDIIKDNSVIRQLTKQANNSFGVHIRRGDAISELNPYRKFYSLDIDKYITEIRKQLEIYDTFFISTDCKESFNRIKSIFGDKCLYLKKTFTQSEWNSPKNGIKIARAEQFILGNTKHLIRSEWSSFAEPIYTTNPKNKTTTIIK